MKALIPTLAAAAMLIPAGVTLDPASAEARVVPKRHVVKVCRKSSGTTGLIAGGVAGAVVGGKLIGGGLAGPLVGAAGGALAGRAIDRSMTAKKRCHYETR